MGREGNNRLNNRGSLLPAEKRLLLHIGGLRDIPNQYDVNPQRTLNRMGATIRVSRTHMSRVVSTLKKERLIATHTGRPRGGTRICEYCVLTPEGLEEARKLSEELEIRPVYVTLPEDSEEQRVLFGTLGAYLTQHSVISEPTPAALAAFVDSDGHLEAQAILDSQKGGMVHLMGDAPRVGDFFGRTEELGTIKKALSAGGARAVVVQGIPGMGKSTLAARLMDDVKGDWNIQWLNIHEYTTTTNILTKLVEFTTALELREGPDIPPESAKPDIELFVERFLEALGDEPSIIILDDFHASSTEVRQLVSALIYATGKGPGLRLMILGRYIPRIYDRRAVVSREEVFEFELGALDPDAGVEFFKHKGFSEEQAREAFESTQGVPFYMEISDSPEEMRRHLSEEVFRKLTPEQLDIMDVLSTFRISVVSDAVFRKDTVGPEHLENLLSRSLIKSKGDGTIYSHDILRTFFYRRLSPAMRIELHKYCAEFLEGSEEPDVSLEMIYHYLGAGEQQTAAVKAIDSYEDILLSGNGQGLTALMDRFDPREIEDKTWIGLCLAGGRSLENTGDYLGAVKFYESAYGRASETGDKGGMSRALCRLGFVHEELSMPDDVEGYLSVALEACTETKDDMLMVEVLRGMGRLHWTRSEHEKGKKRYQKALDILEKYHDDRMEGTILVDMANIHWDHDDNDSAMRYGVMAIEALVKAGDLKQLGRAHLVVGLIKISMGDYTGGIDHLSSGRAINETLHDAQLDIYSSINLAHAYALDGNYENTARILEMKKDTILKSPFKNIFPKLYRAEGLLAESRLDHSKADYCFEKAMSIAKERFPRFSHKQAEEYSVILLERGEPERAIEVLERSLEMGAGEIPAAREKLESMIEVIRSEE